MDSQNAIGRREIKNRLELPVHSAKMHLASSKTNILERLYNTAKSRAVHKGYKLTVNPDILSLFINNTLDTSKQIRSTILIKNPLRPNNSHTTDPCNRIVVPRWNHN